MSETTFLALQERMKQSKNKALCISPSLNTSKKATPKNIPRVNVYGDALANLLANPHLRTGVKNGKRVGNACHEHWEQIEVFNWIFMVYGEYLDDFYAVGNGGIRIGYSGYHLKVEGVQSGQPDINADLPRGIYHGLRIELKWGKNTPSDAQILVMNRRKNNGYFCALCYSSKEAIAVIAEYLNLKPKESMTWNTNESLWLNKN